jgi:hypothetical protein
MPLPLREGKKLEMFAAEFVPVIVQAVCVVGEQGVL